MSIMHPIFGNRADAKESVPARKSGLPAGFFCGYLDNEDVSEYFGENEN